MKATVEHLRSEYAFSERHACQLVGLAGSTYRYQPCKNDAALREQLQELAQEKPRYGYRRLHVLLQRAGVMANHKRVWRVYHAAGLSVKRRRRKRLVRVGRPQEAVSAPNQEWALDFRFRPAGHRPERARTECGGHLHARVYRAGSGYQLCQPACDARSGGCFHPSPEAATDSL